MSQIVGENLFVAVVAFVAVALAILSLVLLWEGIRQLRKRQAVARELRKLREPAAREEAAGGLLREEKEEVPWLTPFLLRIPRIRDLEHFLAQADTAMSPGTFLLLTVGLAAAFGLALTVASVGWLLALAAAALGAYLPYAALRRKRKKRYAAFEGQFPEAIELLTRSVRAGHALSTGLRVVAEEIPQPCAGEFRQVFEEHKFGLPLREALLALGDRMDLVDVRIFATAVLIQRDSGGNLAEILDNLAYVIRERFKFRRQLRVYTAQGRLSGIVMVAVPPLLGFLMYLLNPEYMSVLFTEPMGRLMLLTAATLQLFGWLVVKKIIAVEF